MNNNNDENKKNLIEPISHLSVFSSGIPHTLNRYSQTGDMAIPMPCEYTDTVLYLEVLKEIEKIGKKKEEKENQKLHVKSANKKN